MKCPNCNVDAVEIPLLMSTFWGCPQCKEDVTRVEKKANYEYRLDPSATMQTRRGVTVTYTQQIAFKPRDKIQLIKDCGAVPAGTVATISRVGVPDDHWCKYCGATDSNNPLGAFWISLKEHSQAVCSLFVTHAQQAATPQPAQQNRKFILGMDAPDDLIGKRVKIAAYGVCKVLDYNLSLHAFEMEFSPHGGYGFLPAADLDGAEILP